MGSLVPSRRRSGFVFSWGAVGILALCVSMITSLIVGIILQRPDKPRVLSQEPMQAEIQAIPSELPDRRKIELVPELQDAAVLRVLRSGTITRFSCRPGAVLRSGTFPVSVDGERLLVLSTSVPLWRDIEPNMKGDDVAALQKALESHGRKITVTHRFDMQTRRALDDIYRAAKQNRPGPSLQRNSIIWLAPGLHRIAKCDASLGQLVSSGNSIITLQRKVKSFKIKAIPENLVGGPRRLTVDDTSMAVSELKDISGSRPVAELSATASYRTWLDSDGKVPMTADLSLSRPIIVLPVPATAVVLDSSEKTCLTTPEGIKRVTVVSSSMGRSLVTWKGISRLPVKVLTSPGIDVNCG